MPSVLQILDSSSVLWIQKACHLKAHVENIILINILQNLIYIREYLANTHALVSWIAGLIKTVMLLRGLRVSPGRCSGIAGRLLSFLFD